MRERTPANNRIYENRDNGPKRAVAVLLVAFGVYLLLATATAFFDDAIAGAFGEMSQREFTPVGPVT